MQQTFLQEAAARLYERYGDDISSLRIVLPSRRARLFFSDALSALTSRPIWQPRYISMDDIMSRYSTLAVGEKLRLITELYRIYSDYPPHEPFDKFYFWGEILLSDFDLIDKYMIDADMLFRNLCDIKEIEADLSYLSEDMRRVIHAFWSHFADTAALSTEKRIFLDRWLSLAPIYHRLRERLTSLGIAYTGMIYRSAVENIEQGNTPEEEDFRYIFIGFNALSECERRILKYLDRQGRCDFLWDYDSFYTEDKNQEAGYFLRDNIREFKPLDDITHDNFLSINKKINAISCVSNVVQCKHVNSLLHDISPSLTFDKQTAIVLTDESLLQPLLHSLPQSVAENVNVTMGYPLRQTTAYSLIERLIELQKRCRTGSQTSFYHADVVGILSHPYLNDSLGEVASKLREQIIKGRFIRIEQEFFNVHESLSVIFSPAERYSSLSKYLLQALNTVAQLIPEGEEQSRQISYLSLIADNISDLDNVIKDCQIELSNSIYTSLLRRHLQSVRIPFSGEPLQGLQVMGILETRNIDFRNVILLSASDDNFPGKIGSASSFIPYNLRAAYVIPTPEHHESVYAYYFYRLLQRAERIDILYCSHADEKSTGEQSRYIYQLDYESPYTVHRTNVGVDVALDQPTERIIEKRGRIAEALQRYVCADGTRAERRLSPSAFSQYISCPMRFYLSAIARIKSSDTLSEDVDHPMFGNILHSAMQRLYSPLAGVANPATDLEHLLSSHKVERAVKDAIDKEYLNKENADQSEYTGTLLLVRDIITKYIRQGIIPYDKRHNDFAVKSCEEKIYTPFTLSNSQQVEIGGIADRIDSLDSGALRVVDYKTGRAHLKASTIEDIFEGEKRDEMKYLFQTMLYSMVLHHSLSREVVPSLYYARDMNQPSYSPRLIIDGQEVTYSAFAAEFEKLLRQKLDELFDLHTPFKCCPEQESGKICAYCDFKTICKR
ncbi:MAG: PD-(D/E)XK nuclease family protein [Alistipes sp.]|nr:PD-(D/E)XK nuclease family protein [Alistipes sp.]